MYVVKTFQLRSHPCDWTMAWSGTNLIYGWGHNHRGQLGGVEGPKVKIPQQCDSLSPLKPVQICGGEQSLFIVTADGKVSLPVIFSSILLTDFEQVLPK